MHQQKVIEAGRIHSWNVDLESMANCASWAGRSPDLLAEEMAEILRSFPTLIATLGTRLDGGRCWVEAHEPVLCPRCSEIVVFDRGVRCARCQAPVEVPDEATVGLVGRVPAPISGRPFEAALDRRLAAMRAAGDPRTGLFEESVIEADGQRYLAPRFGLWFSQSWPHADPPVMVWSDYFEILDIPPDHVYLADQYYRLCLYATWREQPAAAVLHNRVVPRLLIDLMVADLVALDELDNALDRLDSSLYDLYNVVGRPRQAEPLARIYEELISGAGR